MRQVFRDHVKQLGLYWLTGLFVIGSLYIYLVVPAHAEQQTANAECQDAFGDCLFAPFSGTTDQLANFAVPAFVAPEPVSSSVPRKVGNKIIVDYSVRANGTLTASIDEFRTQADETLNSQKGWARMGVVFNQVSSGGAFTLYLSEAALVPSFSPTVCDAEYSCQVGSYVIINQDRWLNGTSTWNAAGGTIRDYRHMVINHETGHWLGHDHPQCRGPGQSAPVMRQQSIDLQGCTFNPWPLDSELWSTKLGI